MKAKILVVLFFVAVVGAAFSSPGAVYAGDIVIIANKNVAESSLSSEEVKNIFLFKKKKWGNGQSIDFVVLKDGAVQEGFLKNYAKKTPSQFKRYFKTLVFTGKGKPPKSFATEAELIGYVASTEGAIGYASSGAKTGSVKTIQVN